MKIGLANKITLIRIFCIPFLIFFLFKEKELIAFLIFIFASFSDFLDGYIARKGDKVSSTGKILDPLADKVLVYAIFLCFIELHLIPFWMVIIILGRDFLVMGLRVKLAERGVISSSIKSAKIKTLAQYVAVVFVFLNLIGKDLGVKIKSAELITYILMLMVTLLAVISGIQHWIRSREYIL
ncbi:MAG: CDP-diacylglycerol--glycerol-3-phosphate 3-phosphatidyltransferase [Candidatus Aerophobetes bacterium]|nr:CDP-diacylglycerol--glycerol-3-phosphate 3-phosphatidyltransferase [Candidatus Aerophobetes bacterium]